MHFLILAENFRSDLHSTMYDFWKWLLADFEIFSLIPVELLTSENSFQKGNNNKKYPTFLVFHPFIHFIFDIFSTDWFDCFYKQIRNNSEIERQKKQLWKVPQSHRIPSTPQDIQCFSWNVKHQVNHSSWKGKI